jgi:microcystin-dependent protein
MSLRQLIAGNANSGWSLHNDIGAGVHKPGDLKWISSESPLLPGFLEIDGTNISRTTYPNLFAEIGVTYGIGDGISTFALPYGYGQTLRHRDPGATIDVDAPFRNPQTSGVLIVTTGDYHMTSTTVDNIFDTSIIPVGASIYNYSGYFSAPTNVVAILGPNSIQVSNPALVNTSGGTIQFQNGFIGDWSSGSYDVVNIDNTTNLCEGMIVNPVDPTLTTNNYIITGITGPTSITIAQTSGGGASLITQLQANTAAGDSAQGQYVGSVQPDQVVDHSHYIPVHGASGFFVLMGAGNPSATFGNVYTSGTGGSETRGKNINGRLIIKY